MRLAVCCRSAPISLYERRTEPALTTGVEATERAVMVDRYSLRVRSRLKGVER
jgi:hypothetical protein